MKLPDYFLADLPSEAPLSPQMVQEACLAIKRNQRQYLAEKSTARIIQVLAATAEDWLAENNPYRAIALRQGQVAAGFPPEVLAEGIQDFFRSITVKNLETLIRQDLGELERLDAMVSSRDEERNERASFARSPELLVHFAAGNLPCPTWTSMILGLLTRSAQFVKCASGTSLLPRLLAHSIHEREPKLGSCLEVAEWKGGNEPLENALFAEADCVTATGSDESLARIRSRVPTQVRFVGYGHRVSFGYVAQEVLEGAQVDRIAANAALDVTAWNQMGCLSPHVFYVETGAHVTPAEFAARLAHQLQLREGTHPRGQLTVQESSAIASRRSFYEIRASNSRDTLLWKSGNSTAWTVVFENDPLFQLSCLNRMVYVKAVADLDQALHGADHVRGKVSTVGVASTEDRACHLALRFARWGASRVCPLGKMQQPPLTWRHDGRPALGDLITWADWEK
jgi:hypothetical protein